MKDPSPIDGSDFSVSFPIFELVDKHEFVVVVVVSEKFSQKLVFEYEIWKRFSSSLLLSFPAHSGAST